MIHRNVRRKIAAMLLFIPLFALTGCVDEAEPDEVEWKAIETIEIVEIDDQAGIYISGTRYSTESEPVIDYKYAYELPSGGVRQAMVSDLWESHDSYDYPGSDAVTIYHDIDEDAGDKARIEVLMCTPTSSGDEPLDQFFTVNCVMPDGTKMGGSQHRIDIHVPKGSIADADSQTPKSNSDE